MEKMAERGLTFIEAASYLKLITADEATVAPGQSQRRTAQDGIIQSAIRRLSIGQVATVPPSIYVKPSKHLLLAYNPDHPHCHPLPALRTPLLTLPATNSPLPDVCP